MKKRLLSLAMALVMCLSLLPAAAFASMSDWIESVEVDFALPAAGETPAMDLDRGADGYSIAEVRWQDVTDPQNPSDMSGTDRFQAGGVYQLTYEIQIHPGWYTDGDTTVRFPDGAIPDQVTGDEWNVWCLTRFVVSDHPGDVAVDETNFPCSAFRSYVLDNVPGAGDGVLTLEERSEVLKLEPTGDIYSVEGIEYFHNLRYLDMDGLRVSRLSLRGNPLLRELHMEGNKVTTLELTGNPWVEEVYCANNMVQALVVSGCRRLRVLDADNNNLTGLSLEDTPALQELYCNGNNMGTLRLRHLPDLQVVHCSSHVMKSLELRYLPALRDLECGSDRMQTLDISLNDNLEKVRLHGMSTVDLTVSWRGVDPRMLGFEAREIQGLQGGYATEAGYLCFDSDQDKMEFRVDGTPYVLHKSRHLDSSESARVTFINEWNTANSDLGGYAFYADEEGIFTLAFPSSLEGEYMYGARQDGFDLWDVSGTQGFLGHYACGDTVELQESGAYEAVMCWDSQLESPDLDATTQEDTGSPYLEWSRVDGAVEYEVQYITEQDCYTTFYTTRGSRVRHGSAMPGLEYTYRVRAIDEEGNPGRWSLESSAYCVCAVPDLMLETRSDGKPVLYWEEVKGAVGYEVDYVRGEGSFEELKTVKGTKLTHSSARYGENYTYIVRAIAEEKGCSSRFSLPVSVTVERGKPAAPNLTASNKRTTGKPYLKWGKVDGAEKYEVYRATSKDGKYTRLWTGSGTALTNGSAKTGTTYYYKVRAIAADGTKGDWSTIKTRTCDLAQPDVTLISRNGHPYLYWKHITGAVKYEVYCSTDGGSFQRLLTVKGTTLTHSSAKRGHTYRYKVRAIAKKSAANSSWSYYDTVTIK